MKDVEKTDDEPIEAPAKTSKIVLILLILNLGASGFAAFLAMTAAPVTVEAAEEKPAVDAPGPLHAFEPFVVNLNDVENPRFLKVTVDAELRDEHVIEILDEPHVRIARDAVMRYLSNLTMKDIMGEAGKDAIATAVTDRLNKSIGEGSVKRVLFAEFVVQ